MKQLAVFVGLIGVFFCALPASCQQQHGITGVLQPDTGDLGSFDDIVSATINLLPEVTDVLDQLSRASANSRVSDPSYIEKVVSSFLPLSKKVYIANAKAEGKPIEQDQISRLNAAELVVPSVFKFMNRMRSSQFFDREPENVTPKSSGFSAGTFEFTNSRSTSPEGADVFGRYAKMVAATNNLLPVLADVFRKITTDPDRPNPSDSDFMEKMMVAFLPASRQILQAATKAEGRVVRKEEFDQLDQTKPVMPNVFNFMDRMRKSDFYSTGSSVRHQTGFSAGNFKFNDAEKSTLVKSETLPNFKHSSGI